MALLDGLLDNATELLTYNRENYFFDARLRQEREYQEQNVRVKQFELYRQDVRDLVRLTTGKKDSFLAPCAILLGGCLTMLVEGSLENLAESKDHLDIVENDHEWLIWLYTISLAQAVLYILLSMWLSLHASVAAHSFGVRLLTQFVRLPVPDKAKLDAARTYAADFEGQNMQDILKVPMWRKQLDRMAAAMGEKDSDDEQASGLSSVGHGSCVPPDVRDDSHTEVWLGDQKRTVMSLKHVRLYRELQSHWQAHDAYASVCLALGTYTLVQAFAYYTLALFVVKLGVTAPAMGASILFSAAGWLLIQLDVAMKTYVLQIGAVMLMCGPVLISISLCFYMYERIWYHRVLVLAAFIQHWVLIVCIMYVARAEQLESYRLQSEAGGRRGRVAVPTRFRWVLFVDVFGWIEEPGATLVEVKRKMQRPKRPPPGLIFAGQHACWKLSIDIHRQLLNWELALERHPHLLAQHVSEQVIALRKLFMDIVRKLPRPDAGETGEVCPQSPTNRAGGAQGRLTTLLELQAPQIPIWLHLQDSYMCVAPLEQSREAPPNAVVSFMGSVREQISVLRKKQEVLVAMQAAASVQGPCRPLHTPSQIPHQFSEVGSGSEHTSASSSPRSMRRFGREAIATVRRKLEKQASRIFHDDEDGVEMTDMGSREQSDTGQVQSVVRTPSFAEQAYYPRFDGRRESTRAPGQVPCAVFTRASGLLVFVWFLGTLWYGLESLDILQMVHPITLGTRIRVSHLHTGEQARYDSLDMVSMVCHEKLGASVLVADRFQVWELSAANDWVPQHSHSVDQCLDKDSAFRSIGLRGLHLQCPSQQGHCFVILEGAQPGAYLQCQLRPIPRRSLKTPSFTRPMSLRSTWAGEIVDVQRRSWKMPQKIRWHKCCMVQDRLLALGVAKQGRLGELWTFPVPLD